MRLTLRTLLAYLDDTLPGDEAKLIGQKVAESKTAQELVETIRRVTRRRRLSTPPADKGNGSDPNTVAEYLSDALPSDQMVEFEKLCLDSDVHLAEAAACHQILTLLLSEPVRVPPTARQRMYRLVTGPESLPNKKPGKTLPVGGVLPDEPLPHADDSDAAYLLGMKAFGQTTSPGQRAVQLAILAALILGLGLTAYAAWPKAHPADLPPPRQDFVVAVPAKPAEEAKPKPDAALVKPDQPMPPPVELPKDEQPAAPPPMPMDTKPPMTLVPAAQPPKADAQVVGQLEAADKVVVLADRGDKWVRVMAKMPAVATNERLLALPGYKASVKLDAGPVVDLWGNVPDQAPIPLLESSVTLHAPYDGFDADLTLHTGRIYLTTRKPGIVIRVRSSGETWDVTLPDDKAEVVVETLHRLVPGLLADVDPTEKPLATIQLAVLKGSAKLKVRYKNLPDLVANDTVFWSNKGVGFQGPKKLAANPLAVTGSLLSRTPPVPNEALAKATQAVLGELADGIREPDAVRVRLAELLPEPGGLPEDTMANQNKRVVRPCIAVLAHAAIGELSPVAEGLSDETRPRVRDAAVYGLVSLTATSPDALDRLAKLLTDKYRLTPDQVQVGARLLRGPSDMERADPKCLDQLLEYLNSPALSIRELAFWQLLNEVDPEARTMRPLSSFDLAATGVARDNFLAAWKRRVEELKKKMEK